MRTVKLTWGDVQKQCSALNPFKNAALQSLNAGHRVMLTSVALRQWM